MIKFPILTAVSNSRFGWIGEITDERPRNQLEGGCRGEQSLGNRMEGGEPC